MMAWSGKITRSCIIDEIEEACNGTAVSNSKILEDLLSLSHERDQRITLKGLGYVMCSNVEGICYLQGSAGSRRSKAEETSTPSAPCQSDVVGVGLPDSALELLGSYLDSLIGPQETTPTTLKETPISAEDDANPAEKTDSPEHVTGQKLGPSSLSADFDKATEGSSTTAVDGESRMDEFKTPIRHVSEGSQTSSPHMLPMTGAWPSPDLPFSPEPEHIEEQLSCKERLIGAVLSPTVCAPFLRRLKGQGEEAGEELVPPSSTGTGNPLDSVEQLYRAVVGHPLVSGRMSFSLTTPRSMLAGAVPKGGQVCSAPSAQRRRRHKEKKEKKKSGSELLAPKEPFIPDLESPALPTPELCKQTALLMAKASTEGGVQALLIAAQVAYATFLCPATAVVNTDSNEDVPLRGVSNSAALPSLLTLPTSALLPDVNIPLGPVLYLLFHQLGVVPNPFAVFQPVAQPSSAVVESSNAPIVCEGEDQPLLGGGAEADEAMLLAQALALSMKELNEDFELGEEASNKSITEKRKGLERKGEVEEKTQEQGGGAMSSHEPFSPVSMLLFPPFGLQSAHLSAVSPHTGAYDAKPVDDLDTSAASHEQLGDSSKHKGPVLAETAVLAILAYLDVQSRAFMEEVKEGTEKVSVPAAVAPHGTLFRLLHFLLHQLTEDLRGAWALAVADRFAAQEEEFDPLDYSRRDRDWNLKRMPSRESARGQGARKACEWRERLYRRRLFLSCALISSLKILQANLTQVERSHLPPSSVGLGINLFRSRSSSKIVATSVSNSDGEARGTTPTETLHPLQPTEVTPATSPAVPPRKGLETKSAPALERASSRSWRSQLSQTGGKTLATLLNNLLSELLSLVSPEADPTLAITLALPPLSETVRPSEQALLELCLRAERQMQLCALDAWSAGLATLLPTHAARYDLLMALFTEVPPPLPSGEAGTGENELSLQRLQLNALCKRLAQPDLAPHFVGPVVHTSQCEEDALPIPESPSGLSRQLSREEVMGHLRALLPGGDQTGTAGEGAVQRMYQVLYEGKESSSTGTSGLEPFPRDDSLAAMLLASLASSAPNLPSATNEDTNRPKATEPLEQVPGISSAGKGGKGDSDRDANLNPSALPHLLTTLVDRLSNPTLGELMDQGTPPAELTLLRAIQYQLCRLLKINPAFSGTTNSGTPGSGAFEDRQKGGRSSSTPAKNGLPGQSAEGSEALSFDFRKASSNIALSDNDRRARQKPSKSWGSVFAKVGYAPNTGVHEWLVRLDRCERGHVFLGVATASATTSTYVGGDRHGWGLIGTRALWHRRTKTTGDYGEGFMTGSVIKMRLDTDEGTLSYGGASPGGSQRDWGIAFENLPRDEPLFPAVGLYQKDDQVTLLSAMSEAHPTEAAQLTALAHQTAQDYAPLLHYSRLLLDAVHVLVPSAENSSNGSASRVLRHPLISCVVPLTSALLLAPRQPYAAGLLATQLLSSLTVLTKKLDDLMRMMKITGDTALELSYGTSITGSWKIISAAAAGIPAQEYIICFKQQDAQTSVKGRLFTGSGKGGLSTVEVKGILHGMRIVFLETWRQGGTCLVEGQVSPIGDYFHGTYRDTRSGTRGLFEAVRLADEAVVAPNTQGQGSLPSVVIPPSASAAITASLCSLLVGKYASWLIGGVEILSAPLEDDNTGNRDSTPIADEETTEESMVAEDDEERKDGKADASSLGEGQLSIVSEWLKSPLFESGLPFSELLPQSNATLSYYTQDLKTKNNWWLEIVVPCAEQKPPQSIVNTDDAAQKFIVQLIAGTDGASTLDLKLSGAVGASLFLRQPGHGDVGWDKARRSIAAALLVHTGGLKLALECASVLEQAEHTDAAELPRLLGVWRAARRLTETALRRAKQTNLPAEKAANEVVVRAKFIIGILPSPSAAAFEDTASREDAFPTELADLCIGFLKADVFDYDLLRTTMVQASTQVVFTVIGLRALSLLLGLSENSLLKQAVPPEESGHLEALLSSKPTSMCVLASAFHFLPATLQGLADPFSVLIGTEVGESGNALMKEDQFGVLERLAGVNQVLVRSVGTARDALIENCLVHMSRSDEMDTKLLFVQTLGTALKGGMEPAFIVQTRMVSHLQKIIAEVRTPDSTAPHLQEPFQKKMTLGSQSRLIRAALLVIELLVPPVAQLQCDESKEEVQELTQNLLSLLFAELLGCLEILSLTNSGANADPAPKDELPRITDDVEGEELLEGNKYCYKLLYFLGLLCRNTRCAKLICVPKWLRLLFTGIQINYAVGQRRLLRLMRSVLKAIDPAVPFIALPSNKATSFEILKGPLCNEVEGNARPFGEEVIGILLKLAGVFSPAAPVLDYEPGATQLQVPAGASKEKETKGAPGEGKEEDTGEMGFVAPVVAETIALLRALHEDHAWTKHINEAIRASLSQWFTSSSGVRCLLPLEEEVFGIEGREEASAKRLDLEASKQKAVEWFGDASKEGGRAVFLSAISSLGILGGFVDGLRVGGVLQLRPFSLVGVSESLALRLAAVAHTAGICVQIDRAKRTAEVVLVEKDRQVSATGMSSLPATPKVMRNSALGPGSVSFSGTQSVRPVKMGIEDLIPMSETSPALAKISSKVARTILQALSDDGLPWIVRRLKQAVEIAVAEEAEATTNDTDAEETKGEDEDPDGLNPEKTEEKMSDLGEESRLQEVAAQRAEWVRLADSLALQSAYAVAAFRAGGQVLTRQGSERNAKKEGTELEAEDEDSECSSGWNLVPPETLSQLLHVAVSPTQASGGLSALDTVEEAWVDTWGRWCHKWEQKLSAPILTSQEQAGQVELKDETPMVTGRSHTADVLEALGQTLSSISLTAAMSLAGAQQGTVLMDTSAAVGQMMEMGFPRDWCVAALRRCSNVVEQAVTFCFEHSAEMDQILAEEQALTAAAHAAATARGHAGGAGAFARSTEAARRNLERTLFTKQLVEMGFPPSWCSKALAASRNNVDAALTWILTNGEALAAEDHEEPSPEPTMTQMEDVPADTANSESKEDFGPNPLKRVSGEALIGEDLLVEGVSAGGFASVGCRGCLLSKGKWYYELQLRTSGCMQVGWADAAYLGNAEVGDGVGDGPHSWAYDGWRQYRWHDGICEWGARWSPGDVVGVACDLDARTISFYLNGRGQEIGMGEAFSGISYSGGIFPCVSFNRRERMQFNLGYKDFKFPPSSEYRPVIEAVMFSSMSYEVLRNQLLGPPDLTIENPKEADLYFEDCLEEEVGGESFLCHNRYFQPDSSANSGQQEPLTVRSWCGGSLGPVHCLRQYSPSSKATEEDEELDMLLALSCDLCILYARRTCLVLLSLWGEAFAQTSPLRTLLSESLPGIELGHREEACSKLLLGFMENGNKAAPPLQNAIERLFQLAAVEGSDASQAFQGNSASSTIALMDSSDGLWTAFQCGGASALRKLAAPLLGAAKAREGDLGQWTLRNQLLKLVAHHVLGASSRNFSPTLPPTISLTGIQPKEVTDSDALRQPNLALAVWLTSILVEVHLANSRASATQDAGDAILKLFFTWSVGLKSANLMVKMLSASILSGLMREVATGRLSQQPELKTQLCQILSDTQITRVVQLTVRRIWAERVNAPIYSRFLQSMVDLCSSVHICQGSDTDFISQGLYESADAAMPRTLSQGKANRAAYSREWDRGYTLSDQGWELWSGFVKQHTVEWEKPPRVNVRPSVETNNAPPPLLPGCLVIRGPDFGSHSEMNEAGEVEEVVTAPSEEEEEEGNDEDPKGLGKDGKVKVSIGTVLEITEWGGVPGLGRSVRWPNGDVGTYRWGGEGCFDIKHVEVNEEFKIKKRYPLPETKEDRAAQRCFGNEIQYGVMLHIRPSTENHLATDGVQTGEQCFEGILEWPDFSAAVAVTGCRREDGSITFSEQSLIWGADDQGWDARFAEGPWHSGTSYTLAPRIVPGVAFDELEDPTKLAGEFSYSVTLGGRDLHVTGEMQLGKRDLFSLNPHSNSKAQNITVSQDGRSAVCISSECRGTVYGTVGFASGCHYWEVKIEQAEPGSVFVGVAEKQPVGAPPRLSRWQGWGFVNYRATYCNTAERVYGEHFTPGDTVGLLLDMNHGHLSFFLDGMKYGEHLVADLGLAFDGLTGKPTMKPRTLFPVLGFRKNGDRITLTSKWISGLGVHPSALLEDALATSRMLEAWSKMPQHPQGMVALADSLPKDLYVDAWRDHRRWHTGRWLRTGTRGTRGDLTVDLDRSPISCVRAGLLLGISQPLFAGDKVRLSRSCGRILDVPEEATVLGAYRDTLWYSIDSQNDGSVGGGMSTSAWCWAPCEVDGISLIKRGNGLPGDIISQIPHGMLACYTGARLRVIYEGGAVVRDGIEIDTSNIVGNIENGAVVTALERRMNSSSVARYLVKHKGLTGWISERIRGGDEQLIVERVLPDKQNDKDTEDTFPGTGECSSAGTLEFEVALWEAGMRSYPLGVAWLDSFNEEEMSFEDFHSLARGDGYTESGCWTVDMDFQLVSAISAVSDLMGVDPTNLNCNQLLKALLSEDEEGEATRVRETVRSQPGLSNIPAPALLARISVLRVFNARLGRVLPLLTITLPEEDWERFTTSQGGTSDLATFSAGAALGDNSSMFVWTPPSLAQRLRRFRGLAFMATKLRLWNGILAATTTSTTLPHDEYEDPREIKTIKINRVRATPQRLASIQHPTERLRQTVFGQLHREMRSWRGSDFRRAHLAKGHGGQRRAFKVRFVGEGVNDYGGPYRAVFDQVWDELQFDQLCIGSQRPGERCLLPLLVPCPNRRSNVGATGRDKFVFSPGPSANSPLTQELAQFLGRLVGMARRHGLQTALDLPSTVWRPLVASSLELCHLDQVDTLAVRSLGRIERQASEAIIEGNEPQGWEEITLSTHLSDGTCVPLIPGGERIPINLSNWKLYMRLVERCRLAEATQLLRAFRDGLGSVLPVELLPLFSSEELEKLICGESSIDVDLLQKNTDYDEGVSSDDDHVKFFWETLKEMRPDEKTAFLRFVWARSRMPTSSKDFPMNFKIQAPQGSATVMPDDYLPHAQTCFFSLSLPRYSNKAILRQKLHLAIHNSPNMDADVRLRNADGWADVV